MIRSGCRPAPAMGGGSAAHRRRPYPAGAAVTLVELTLALAVGLVVMIIVWELFRMSNRLFHASRKRLSSLQGAFILSERVCKDLASVVVVGKDRPLPSDGKKTLDFTVIDPPACRWKDSRPSMVLKRMRYRYDPSDCTFYRKDGNGDEEPFTLSRFEVVLFSVLPAGEPPAPMAEHLAFRITCAADDDIEANWGKGDLDPSRRDREVVTMISAVGFHQKAGEDDFPWWTPNPLPAVAYSP